MLLWELFEALEPGDAQALQAALNRLVYMPENAMRAGKPVIKLNLSGAHFVQRAIGDKTDRFDEDPIDWTLKEVQSLLVRAFTDNKLGFASDIQKWCGMDTVKEPSGTRGHQIFDPVTKLRLGFAVSPNPKVAKLTTPYAGLTREGKIEPRNTLTAMTIFRPQRPHYSTPHDNPIALKQLQATLGQSNNSSSGSAKGSFIKPANKGFNDRFASGRKAPVRGGADIE